MGLTAAEQAELNQLEKQYGGLSADEEAELAALEKQFSTEQEDKIVNEMPEGLEGRFVFKNFGADPEASFNYLQKVNPNFEIKKDKSGEIIARKRGDKVWGRLDPKGFDVRDLTDVAYDLPMGAVQGAATAAAGLAGAGAGGVGAIPAAMGASALSGTAIEGLRQMIGTGMGIEDNLSGSDLKWAAGMGAASPLLFGTGAATSQAIKMAGREGAKQTAKEILGTQRGLVGRAYDASVGKVAPNIGSFISGENPDVIRKAADILDEVKAADTNPQVITVPLNKAAKEINTTLKQKAGETGKRMDELRSMIDQQPGLILTGEGAVTKGTGTIPAKDFMAPFENLATKLSSSGAGTEAQLKDLQNLADIINSEFKGLPENLTAAQVDNLRKRFKTRAEQFGLNYGKSGQATSATQGASAIDAQIANAFEESRKSMDDAIVRKLEEISPELGSEYSGLKDSYSKIKTIQTEINKDTKNSKALSNFLTRATKDPHAEKQLMEITELTGLDLPDLAYREQALRTFSKPSTAVRSIGGSTSTSRTIPLSTAGGAAGYYLGQKFGFSPFISASLMSTLGSTVGSPAAMRTYMQGNQLMRNLPANLPLRGGNYYPYLMMNPELHDQGDQ